MSRVHPQQAYVSAYYRPAPGGPSYAPVVPTMDRREYTMNAINTPATFMPWPVYPNTTAPTNAAPTPVVTNPMHVFPSRSRSVSARSKPSRSSSRSRPAEEGSSGYNTTNSRDNSVGRNHSVHDFFSLRRSRSTDSRKSGRSGKSGISSKSLGEYVSGVVQMMNPFGPRGRSKSRDRSEFMYERDVGVGGADWYTPATPYTGKKLVKSQSTRRPARVPTYESAPAPSLHRSHTTSNVTHHVRQSRPTERRVERSVDHSHGHSHANGHGGGVEERESRSRSRPRAFTPAELKDQATTRRGLQDWIDGRMQEEQHARDIQQPAPKMQTFQPAWRASTSSYANKQQQAPHSVKHSNVTTGIGVPKTSVPPTSKYTTQYTYNGYKIRV